VRFNNIPFKFHIYNFNYILHNYGLRGTSSLKHWIDTNYRLIKALSQLQFLKYCKHRGIFPQHVTVSTIASLNLFHFKAIHKFINLTQNFKFKLLDIEIFDLHMYIRFLKKELISLARELSHLLPDTVWNSIKLHHFRSFSNLNYRLWNSHQLKLGGLLRKSHKDYTNNIKNISYFYSTNKN